MIYINKELLESRMHREAFETDSEMPVETPDEKLKSAIIDKIDYLINIWSDRDMGCSNFAAGMVAAASICRNIVLSNGKDKGIE